jgi:peptidase M28-like protein
MGLMMRAYVWVTAACLLIALFTSTGNLAAIASPGATLRCNSARSLNESLNRVDAYRLIGHLDRLTEFNTRYVNSTVASGTGIAAAATYISNEFSALPALKLSTQNFDLSWNEQVSSAENIIAELPGTDKGEGVIIVGAHYDSISITRETADSPAPGADDNASGVAALVEMARILSNNGPHRATIVFVAFSAEEEGRIGSRRFVSNYLPTHYPAVQAMINLDIIGSSTGDNGVINDREVRLFSDAISASGSRQLARTLAFINQNCAAGVHIDLVDATDRDGRYGDHQSFSDAGYPAVRFTEAAEQTRIEHGPNDTADDIQSVYFSRVVQTVLGSIVALADGPQPPQGLAINGSTVSWQAVSGAAEYVVALRSPGSLVYDEVFEVSGTTVNWSEVAPGPVDGMAIGSEDSSGLIGPLSPESAL